MDYAIIAAGEGSRLREEGIVTPKPLIRIQGEPLLDRLIGIFLRANASSINIIVNEEMTEVQQHLQQMQLPVPMNLIIQSTPSSMHSFYALSHFLKNDKFCLTTVDTIFHEADFKKYITAFEEDQVVDGLMAVTDFIDDESPLYVDTDDTLRILGFLDEAPLHPKYISGGIYCLKQMALPVLNHCMERNVFRMRNYQRNLLSEGLHIKAYPFPKIVDVDHAEDIDKANRFINQIQA